MNTLSTLGPTNLLNEPFYLRSRVTVCTDQSRQFMASILMCLHLISGLFGYFLFSLVLNFTQLSQAKFFYKDTTDKF